VPRLQRELLPPFNEGTLTVNLASVPGITLEDSDRIGALAERLMLEVPEVIRTGRRTGRAELDTHSAGVHQSEIEVELREGRPRAAIEADIRARLATLPGLVTYIGQPISHRLEHLLEGVNGQIIVRFFGDDPIRLRELGEAAREVMAKVPGIVDLQTEKQLDIPELLIDVDAEAATQAGINPGDVAQQAQDAIYGAVVGKAELDGRLVDVRVRADDEATSSPGSIGSLPLATVAGRPVALAGVARVREGRGLDYLNRADGQRVFLVMANVQGRDAWTAAQDVQRVIEAKVPLPVGYSVVYGGEWAAERAAQTRMLWFAALALIAVALALQFHFRAIGLTLLTLVNIPLSLVGCVAALALSRESLSIASALGFVAVCGIACRNTILLLSHYRHLMDEEGQPFGRELVIRGSLERLTPMLMTALTAGLALIPWIVERHAPGREILGPVALVIAGGLLSSTLLDLAVTPAAFYLWGKRYFEQHPVLRLPETAAPDEKVVG
jgi:Cu/Ag efflux pump CusA